MDLENQLKSARDRLACQRDIQLAKACPILTRPFLAEAKNGRASFPRNTTVPVPSLVAEGPARRGRNEFSQCISASLGSLAEVEIQLIMAQELPLSLENPMAPLIGHVHELQTMLHSLKAKLPTDHFSLPTGS